jgi:hypothetical protein
MNSQPKYQAMKLARILAFALSGVLGLTTGVQAQMAIPGKFEVTPIGAASYTIPVQVPPGVAGVEPKLAFSYNTRGGNGLLGVGWSLSGLPSIARCPRTTPQDGVKGTVAYDTNDRFCLDGKRLVVVSGTYGAAGSSYRTEIDSFANVTAYGTAGSGPQYFVAKTKDGQTMEFGNTADSRFAVASGLTTVKSWGLSKVSDAMGNAYSVTYGLPAPITGSTTEFNAYPLRIDYTSNSATGLVAANSVEFTYASRTDVLSGFRGGYPAKTSVLLSSVITKVAGVAVTTYKPTYLSGKGERSVIGSWSMCGADGVCAPATTFGLGGVENRLFPRPVKTILPVSQVESSVVDGQWFSMDTNGDGLADLVHLTSSGGDYRVWLSKGDGTFDIKESTNTVDTNLNVGKWQVLDVDGNGQADLVHLTTAPGLLHAWTSNGDGTFKVTSFTADIGTDTDLMNGQWLGVDVNGDGLGDLIHLTTNPNDDMRVWKSNGDGTFSITQVFGGGTGAFRGGFSLSDLWHVADVNGDGLADLIQFRALFEGFFAYVVRLSNGDGSFRFTQEFIFMHRCEQAVPIMLKPVSIDANGDGITDVLMLGSCRGGPNGQPASGGQPWAHFSGIWLSKGDGNFHTFSLPVSFNMPYVDGHWEVTDVNGDGLADLIHTPTGLPAGFYATWESKGDGTFTVTRELHDDTACSSNCAMMRSGDFTGSGAPGFVRIDGNAVKAGWFMGSPSQNLITSVSDGVGGKTSWSITTLPGLLREGSYIKDLPSDQNTWTLSSAIPVVSSVKTNAGWVHDASENHLDRSTLFSYGAARLERNGRGFLGFSWQQSTDSTTGLNARTKFRQDFPYTGLVASSSTGKGASWDNLTQVSNSYGCTLLDGGASCSVGVGKRYFVYPSQTDSRSWDLDGTALPRTRTLNANPDLYGNIGRVSSHVLNPDGSPTDYSKVVDNTYYNNDARWIIGRLVKSVSTVSGPDVAAPVTPGSGNLPPAPSPKLPQQIAERGLFIMQMLLD